MACAKRVFVLSLVVAAGSAVARTAPFGILRLGAPAPLQNDVGTLFWAAGDIDGDGRTDYVTAPALPVSDPVYGVAFAQGDGSFEFVGPLDLITPGGEEPSTIPTVADTDGDGMMEVVGLVFGGELVGVEFDGRTPLATVTAPALGPDTGIDPVIAVAGDLAGEGADAVVYPSLFGGVAVRWPDGTGVAIEPPAGRDPEVFPVADYNGDGLADVLFGVRSPSALVLVPGTGSRTLGAPLSFPVAEPRGTVVDLDADGAPDYACVESGRVLWYAAFAQGGGQPKNLGAPGGRIVTLVAGGGRPDGTGPVGLVIAVQRGFDGMLGWWADPLAGDDTFGVLEAIDRSPDFGPTVIFEDRDADGRDDLETGSFGVGRYLARGCPAPGRYGAIGAELTGRALHVTASDLDGDGRDELIRTDNARLRLDDADGPGAWTTVSLPIPAGGWMSRVVEIGAGRYIVGTSSNGWAWSFAEQNGVWAEVQRLSLGGATRSFGVADLDADGSPEMAIADYEGLVRLVRIGSDGTLSEVGSFATPTPVGLDVADVTGDGLADVIAGDEVGGMLRVHANLGGLSFAPPATVALPGTTPYWVLAADIDGDGLEDIATGRHGVFVLWGDAGGGLSEPDAVASIEGFANFGYNEIQPAPRADGRLDLILAFGGIGGARSAYLTQKGPRDFVSSPLAGVDHSGATAGDVNGDGVRDVVLVSANVGTADVHLGSAGPCVADVTGDCVVNFFDVAAYLGLFNSQDPAADLAEPFGTLNFFDVAAFIGAYNAGCP
jgi:hypothetical protein